MQLTLTDTVLTYIRDKAPGTLFFTDDFMQIGEWSSIRQALTRLYKRGLIKRAAPGIYYMPKTDKWDGKELTPSAEEIARAISERAKTRFVPTGAYALNLLGLTTQVPGSVAFLTDGAPRKIKTENGTVIDIRHTSDMTWFSYNSKVMLLIVAAMREIGEKELTVADMDIIRLQLPKVAEQDYWHDINLAPVWVAKKLKR